MQQATYSYNTATCKSAAEKYILTTYMTCTQGYIHTFIVLHSYIHTSIHKYEDLITITFMSACT